MSEPSKIFLVDDHPLVREWLTTLINREPNLKVCGEAEDVSQAVRGIVASKPDVAIIDISLKGGSGLELIKSIKVQMPQVAVIVLSMHDEKLYAERSIRAGARGYVMKRETTKRIINAIRQVLLGKLCVSEQMVTALAQKFISGQHVDSVSPIEHLSDRELEVFNLLGQGLETRQIADTLNISIKTVQAYCARIKEKLNLSSAAELLREAIRSHELEAKT